MILNKMALAVTVFIAPQLLTGCADWQTTPRTLDEHHGVAFRQMVQNQTLYPDHGKVSRQELYIDGQKSEQAIRAYRGQSVNLEEGKSAVTINLGGGSNSSSSSGGN